MPTTRWPAWAMGMAASGRAAGEFEHALAASREMRQEEGDIFFEHRVARVFGVVVFGDRPVSGSWQHPRRHTQAIVREANARRRVALVAAWPR